MFHTDFTRRPERPGKCAPERSLCEAVSVQSNTHCRLQKVEEAKNIDCLRKTTRRKYNQPKREAVKVATTNNAMGTNPPKAFGVHILPHMAPDAEHGTTELNICPIGF